MISDSILSHRGLCKADVVLRNQKTNIYHAYGDINIRVSLRACKHPTQKIIKNKIRLITGTLKSRKTSWLKIKCNSSQKISPTPRHYGLRSCWKRLNWYAAFTSHDALSAPPPAPFHVSRCYWTQTVYWRCQPFHTARFSPTHVCVCSRCVLGGSGSK